MPGVGTAEAKKQLWIGRSKGKMRESEEFRGLESFSKEGKLYYLQK